MQYFSWRRTKLTRSDFIDDYLKTSSNIDEDVMLTTTTSTTSTTTTSSTTTSTTTPTTTVPYSCGEGVRFTTTFQVPLDDDSWLEACSVLPGTWIEVSATGSGQWYSGTGYTSFPEGWYCDACGLDPGVTGLPSPPEGICYSGGPERPIIDPSSTCFHADHDERDLPAKNCKTFSLVGALNANTPGQNISYGLQVNRSFLYYYPKTSPAAKLWFIFNDFYGDFDDNTGEFEVTVNLYKPCNDGDTITTPTTSTTTPTTSTTTTTTTTTSTTTTTTTSSTSTTITSSSSTSTPITYETRPTTTTP